MLGFYFCSHILILTDKNKEGKSIFYAVQARLCKKHQNRWFLQNQKNVELIHKYKNWFGLNFAICYFYNAYGPHHDTCNNGWETVVSIFEKQFKKGQPLTICGDGNQRRDFTYVEDIVEGLILASNRLENQEYQLGSGKDYSILEVAQMFGGEIKHIESRPGDRKTGIANVQETNQKLGWIPKMNLENWIKNIILNKND